MAKVYFAKEITSESLQIIYEALGVKLEGKIGVKVSTGEKTTLFGFAWLWTGVWLNWNRRGLKQ